MVKEVYTDGNNESTENTIEGYYTTYFSQFNYGKVGLNEGTLNYGLAIKGGLMSSRIHDYNDYDYSAWHSANNPYFESTAFVGFGGEKFKCNFKVGIMYAFTVNDEQYVIPYYPYNVGVSLCYRINTSKKK